MRDLLSKLDSILNETALNPKDPKGDYDAKKQALADLANDPAASKEPEIARAIDQRQADLDKEAKEAGVFEMGDAFGISLSEDLEICTEIVDILEDGVMIELDDYSLDFLSKQGFTFEDGELDEEKKKGTHGKACWKGYRRVGVNDCTKIGESGLQYSIGVDKHGKDYMTKAAKLMRNGGSQEELGRLRDKESKAYKKEDTAMASIPQFKEFYNKKGQLVGTSDHNGFHYTDEYYQRLAQEFDKAQIDQMASSNYVSQKLKSGAWTVKEGMDEAEYRGKNVPLGKKLPGDVKKSKVYVRKPNGNIVKVNFGDKKMRIKKSNPARRKSFRARHNCKNPGPRWKARYWSCRSW